MHRNDNQKAKTPMKERQQQDLDTSDLLIESPFIVHLSLCYAMISAFSTSVSSTSRSGSAARTNPIHR
jgi:hypothetical protein